ncbi:MAG: sugar phosphate isomerase/epimerase [Sphaerochaeta sp.]
MSIKLGAVLCANEVTPSSLNTLSSLGFETINITFWQSLGTFDLPRLAETVAASPLEVSALSIFGNTLSSVDTRSGWESLITYSSLFGSPYVTGFAGRVTGKSVEDSLSAWKATFSSLLDLAHKYDCPGLLFENCRMGDLWKRGNWNIAINGEAWALMFDTLDDSRLGLQWEPCHQVEAFLDPLIQLKGWLPRVKHVHGKDALVDWDLLKVIGLYSPNKAISSVLPGEGDSDWGAIIQLLKEGDYEGSIDIETKNQTFFPDLEEKKRSREYLQKYL